MNINQRLVEMGKYRQTHHVALSQLFVGKIHVCLGRWKKKVFGHDLKLALLWE